MKKQNKEEYLKWKNIIENNQIDDYPTDEFLPILFEKKIETPEQKYINFLINLQKKYGG